MFMNFIGLLFLSYVDQETPIPVIIAVLLFMGLGFAFFSSPNMNTIMSSVEKNQMSTASGTASTMRIIGQMVSMTIVTLAFSTAFNGSGISQVPDYLFVNTTRFIYLICSGMCLSGVFFSYSRGDLRK
jgi:MFS-type transporter involved in bile tolerance (Atg22 family)